ncbi:hypothetical protein [Solidesulfovibrio sp. C21]|uniref:hypothetical protein n=1 Tax=Solidesulfovibrio sp. C21 TaxID=3398613 RepID=UPI0039FCF64C
MDVMEKAAEEIFRVFMVEHWARFYFAVEQDGVVHLDVPQEELTALRTEYPDLGGFIAGINGQPIDMESSRRSVGEFVFKSMEGGNYPIGTVAKAFDSKPLALLMQLFSVWMSGHEAQLDQETMSFSDWDNLFSEWRKDPAVQRFSANLASTGNPSGSTSGTVH